MSLSRYCQAQAQAQSPRLTEQRLAIEVTRALEAQWDAGQRGAALVPALHRNREMWSLFAAACAAPGNGLPETLRAGIVSLSLWVSRFSSDIVAGREEMEPLLAVNQQLIEGLGAPAAAIAEADALSPPTASAA